jgi:hypothetical protein
MSKANDKQNADYAATHLQERPQVRGIWNQSLQDSHYVFEKARSCRRAVVNNSSNRTKRAGTRKVRRTYYFMRLFIVAPSFFVAGLSERLRRVRVEMV